MEISELIRKFQLERSGENNIKAPGRMKIPKDTVEEIREKKALILAELKTRESEEAEREAVFEQKKEEERKNLLSGKQLVELRFREGEYLSDWTAHGEAATMLEKMGLAKWISGWGIAVDAEVVSRLGTRFKLSEAEKIEKERQMVEERKARILSVERQAKFAEAKKTGKPVIISRRTCECDSRTEECSLDIVTTFAMPDGSEKVTREHTY